MKGYWADKKKKNLKYAKTVKYGIPIDTVYDVCKLMFSHLVIEDNVNSSGVASDSSTPRVDVYDMRTLKSGEFFKLYNPDIDYMIEAIPYDDIVVDDDSIEEDDPEYDGKYYLPEIGDRITGHFKEYEGVKIGERCGCMSYMIYTRCDYMEDPEDNEDYDTEETRAFLEKIVVELKETQRLSNKSYIGVSGNCCT